jgi:CBS domain-containing protein
MASPHRRRHRSAAGLREYDLLTIKEELPMETVRDVMTRTVRSVGPDTPLKDVARELIEHRISGLPVVDDAGQVIGVISEGDLLAKEQRPGAVRHRPLARLFGESAETRRLMAKAEASTAGEAMTSPAITIEASKPIDTAATMMIQRKINRLPVTDGGKLVGIVTRSDVVGTFARSDEVLADVIRDEVLHQALWLDPAAFEVTVTNGMATIHGEVERRSTATILEHMVRMVPGIVSVEANVTWTLDDRDIEAPGPDYFSPKN